MPPAVERSTKLVSEAVTIPGRSMLDARLTRLLTARTSTGGAVVEILSSPPLIGPQESQELNEIDTRQQIVGFAYGLLEAGLIDETTAYADRLKGIYKKYQLQAPEDLAIKIIGEAYVKSREELSQGEPTSWGKYERVKRNVAFDAEDAIDKETTFLKINYASVEDKLAGLTERQKVLMDLVYVDEMSIAEASEVTNSSTANNYQLLRRIKNRFLTEGVQSLQGDVMFDPSDHKKDIDKDVVIRALAGDQNALGLLLGQVQPLIVQYCRARMRRVDRSSISADDVAQEVMLAIISGLPSYKADGPPFIAFAYGIASHKVVDAYRTVERNRSDPVEDVPDSIVGNEPMENVLRVESSEWFVSVLDGLTEKQRKTVVLRVVQGLSAEETADAMGSTPGTVRVAQHRALARLRREIGGDDVPPARNFTLSDEVGIFPGISNSDLAPKLANVLNATERAIVQLLSEGVAYPDLPSRLGLSDLALEKRLKRIREIVANVLGKAGN